MNKAYSFVVSSVQWDIFATLTFRGTKAPSYQTALARVYEWMKWVAFIQSKKLSNLVYLIRVEEGELNRRLHLHLLIQCPEVFIGRFITPPRTLSLAHRRWGHGMTTFRRVGGSSDPAVAYCLKESSGADVYEMDKTSGSTGVVMSKALWKFCKKRAIINRLTATAGTQTGTLQDTLCIEGI